MIAFSIIALCLITVALCFVLPALLTSKTHSARPESEVNLTVLRDQMRELDADLVANQIDQIGYDNAKRELEKYISTIPPVNTTHSVDKTVARMLTITIAVLLPTVALALYYFLGNPQSINPDQAELAANATYKEVSPEIANMVASLERRMASNPDDIEGWAMLARSYRTLGRFDQAARALAHIVKLMPDNPELLADYADTLAMAQNRSLAGEPEKVVARALVIDPDNIKALTLAGTAAFDRQDYRRAAEYWKKILSLVDKDSDIAHFTSDNIDEALKLSGVANSNTDSPASAPTGLLEGEVGLDPALQIKVSANDTVFVFVRAIEGPRFPVAVLRKKVSDLPVRFHLDDSSAMMADVKISQFPLVIVGARISRSGNAMPESGDWEGFSDPVKPGQQGIRVLINSQHK